MGLCMRLHGRWVRILWLVLVMMVVMNAFIFINLSTSMVKGSNSSEKLSRDASHLQAIRKRLNKSSHNSSSLNYLDWDAKDGALDPEIAKLGINRRFISKHVEDRGNELMKEQENNEEDADNDNYNLDQFLFRGTAENSEDHTKGVYQDDLIDNLQPSLTSHSVQELNRRHGYGGRAYYSIPEVDQFVEKFRTKYQLSKFAVDDKSRYSVLLNNLTAQRKRGSSLPAYVSNGGRWPWEKFHYGIHQHYLYDPEDSSIDAMLRDFGRDEIVGVEQKEGGTQIKLIFTFENGGQALFKPMRYGREQETLPDHFYFADFERHNAEIASFHLDKILGFHRVPPTIGRLMNVSKDLQHVSDKKLAKTFFISPAGNLCFHGSCSYYCDSSHPVCGHPMMLEGSLAAFLPPSHKASRKTWRNPWKRSYSKHRKAYWEVYSDLCEKVKQKHPYSEGHRLLDILDMSVFDFLTGNLDRHHYETFQDFGNDTFILHLDNGRGFGKSKYDCMSCLAPVRQCCMIRLSTLTKLVKLYIGPDSMSDLMRSSLTSDPLNPILLEPHLDALDRRVSKILHVINGCIINGKSWDQVIIDDNVM